MYSKYQYKKKIFIKLKIYNIQKTVCCVFMSIILLPEGKLLLTPIRYFKMVPKKKMFNCTNHLHIGILLTNNIVVTIKKIRKL